MSNNLPIPRSDSTPGRTGSGSFTESGYGLREWIGSPVGRALTQALPEVIRLVSRSRPVESRPLVSNILPSSDGASGMTISEVEVDVDVPFIRRMTIRSASSWSISPDVLLAQHRQQRRGRWKLRALAAGALGVAGVVLARRSGVSLPSRLNPAVNLPFISSPSTPTPPSSD
jgi:hypothetical protein